MVSAAQPISKPSLGEEFSLAIHQQTNQQCPPRRIYDSFKTLTQTQGYVKTTCLATATLAAQTVTAILSYMLIEGSIRSLLEVNHNSATFEALRPLGDTAGWAPLAVFTLLVMKDFYERTIGEGEYYKVIEICKNWITDNLSEIQNKPAFRNDLYADIKQTLQNYNSRCFSNRTVAARRLDTWKIFKHVPLDKANGKEYKKEIKLKEIVKAIHNQQKETSTSHNFFTRCAESNFAIGKRGIFAALSARVFGIAIPIFITALSMLSIPGEGALIHQVYVNATENGDALADRGHAGEWPMNLLDTIALAYFLFLWYFFSEGDLSSNRKIYAEQLDILQKNNKEVKYEVLREIGREELIETSLKCHYLRTGTELNFKPYAKAISRISLLVM